MKKARLVWIVAVAFALSVMGTVAYPADRPAGPCLSSGDRVVFLGDSITQQMIYTRYVMDFVALRYPELKVTFRNAGWGGDTAPGGLKRLQRDVLSLKPTVVSICFGMNDGGYGEFKDELYNSFMDGMKGLVSELKNAGVKVVLLTPGCVDPDANSKYTVYNDTLDRFAKGVMDLSDNEKVKAVNIHVLMLDVLTMAQGEDPKPKLIPDGVHPAEPMQAIMAFGLTMALSCDAKPSKLLIDAAKAEAQAERCEVRGLKVTEKAVTFVRTDAALPVYFGAEVERVLNYAPYLITANDYPFRVTGLKSGKWKLVVQGIESGIFASADLVAGVDLGKAAGPWQTLGQEVDRLSAEQESLYFTRWRSLQLLSWPSEIKPDVDALVAKLDKLIAAKEAARAKAVANRTWNWSLTFVE